MIGENGDDSEIKSYEKAVGGDRVLVLAGRRIGVHPV